MSLISNTEKWRVCSGSKDQNGGNFRLTVAMAGPAVATEGEAVAVALGSPPLVEDIARSSWGHQCWVCKAESES